MYILQNSQIIPLKRLHHNHKRRGGVNPPFYMLKKSLAVLGMLIPFYSHAQEKIYYQVQADVYSEPLSIHAFTDDWDAPDFKSGKMHLPMA